MNTYTKTAAWVGLVMSLVLGLLMMVNSSASQSPQGTPEVGTINGAVVQNFPYAFTAGYYLGSQTGRSLAAVISFGAGSNQVAWKNTTGGTVYVKLGNIYANGAASSTVKFYVGTSTTATVTNSFNPATAPFWSQFIDGESVSTSTPAGVWADNIQGHKSTYPGQIAVADGQYLLLVSSSFCTAVGACETATSTNRGYTLVTMPFTYSTP